MAATDYDYVLTRNELIEQAYKKLGVVVQGESMTGNQLDDAVKRLNLIVKSWEADGVHLWREHNEEQVLQVAVSSYALPTNPKVSWVDRAFVRVDDRDHELEYYSWRQFQEISDKEATGRPEIYSVDPRNRTIELWPIPQENDTLVMHCVAMLHDWEDEDEQGDFPGRWQRAIMYALCLDLAEDYPVSDRVYRWMEKQFATTYRLARSGESDNSDREFVDGAYD